jgi:sarcosine oxidase
LIYDLAVVGLGGMGSAVLQHAAERGLSVFGAEQYPPAHTLGASHGKARMIRKAYFEDPAYVPLLLRSYELWDELERKSGRSVLRKTGVLISGPPTSTIVAGVRASAELHGLPIEVHDAGELRRRFPMMRPLDEEIGVFEPDAGVLHPELAVTAQLDVAKKAGATARFSTRVVSWERSDVAGEFLLRLDDGEEIRAKKLALCCGAWLDPARVGLPLRIEVRRKIQAWFAPAGEAFTYGKCPAFLIDRAALGEVLYGFPDFGDGVKAAFHSGGEVTTMDALDRIVRFEKDVAPIQRALDTWMPGAATLPRMATVCQYDMSADEHFVIGMHPGDADTIVATGFSGHGFKFAPVVGEIIADLAADGATRHDIGFLSPARFEGSLR